MQQCYLIVLKTRSLMLPRAWAEYKSIYTPLLLLEELSVILGH